MSTSLDTCPPHSIHVHLTRYMPTSLDTCPPHSIHVHLTRYMPTSLDTCPPHSIHAHLTRYMPTSLDTCPPHSIHAHLTRYMLTCVCAVCVCNTCGRLSWLLSLIPVVKVCCGSEEGKVKSGSRETKALAQGEEGEEGGCQGAEEGQCVPSQGEAERTAGKVSCVANMSVTGTLLPHHTHPTLLPHHTYPTPPSHCCLGMLSDTRKSRSY